MIGEKKQNNFDGVGAEDCCGETRVSFLNLKSTENVHLSILFIFNNATRGSFEEGQITLAF